MTQSNENNVKEAVETRAKYLKDALISKAHGIGFSLHATEIEDAHSGFVLECMHLAARYQEKVGGTSLATFLYSRTINSVEMYLRLRKAGKRTLLRKASDLLDDEGHEYLADCSLKEHARTSFFLDYETLKGSLTELETFFLSKLEDADGNLCQAARVLGVTQKKARLLRESIKAKLSELRDYRADFGK